MKALQIGAVLAVLAVAPLHSQGSKPVYLDPAQPMERRIADVISRMTLEEKAAQRSEEHTSELQSLRHLVCRLLLGRNRSEEHTSELQSLRKLVCRRLAVKAPR